MLRSPERDRRSGEPACPNLAFLYEVDHATAPCMPDRASRCQQDISAQVKLEIKLGDPPMSTSSEGA
jgi:hypothetical protein